VRNFQTPVTTQNFRSYVLNGGSGVHTSKVRTAITGQTDTHTARL